MKDGRLAQNGDSVPVRSVIRRSKNQEQHGFGKEQIARIKVST